MDSNRCSDCSRREPSLPNQDPLPHRVLLHSNGSSQVFPAVPHSSKQKGEPVHYHRHTETHSRHLRRRAAVDRVVDCPDRSPQRTKLHRPASINRRDSKSPWQSFAVPCHLCCSRKHLPHRVPARYSNRYRRAPNPYQNSHRGKKSARHRCAMSSR